MNCEEFRKEVLFFASGESEAPELREHFETCSSCRDEVEKARRFDGLLRSAFEGLAPGKGFEDRVAARALRGRDAGPAARLPSWIPWMCAAASFLLAALTTILAASAWKRSSESVDARLAALGAKVEEARKEAEIEKELLARALLEDARRDVETQNPLRALPLLDHLAARSPSDEVFRLRAAARLASGDAEGAIADASALIEKGRASPEDYRIRSSAYEQLGSAALASTDRAQALILEDQMAKIEEGEGAAREGKAMLRMMERERPAAEAAAPPEAAH